MSEELKPCPFCGSSEIEVVGFSRDGPFFIECGGCALYTHNTDTRSEALEAWNTRAETPQSIPSEREEIVKWLRMIAQENDDRCKIEWADALFEASAAIERGDHLSTRQALEQGSAK